MPDDNTTNLPILDDIIKPGDTDKAVAQPSRKAQSSFRPDVETGESSTENVFAEFDSHTAIDTLSDIAELFTDDQSDTDIIDQSQGSLATATDIELPVIEPLHQQPPAAGDIRQPPAVPADLDALTEEILADMMPALEQMLRRKILQTLKNRYSS